LYEKGSYPKNYNPPSTEETFVDITSGIEALTMCGDKYYGISAWRISSPYDRSIILDKLLE